MRFQIRAGRLPSNAHVEHAEDYARREPDEILAPIDTLDKPDSTTEYFLNP